MLRNILLASIACALTIATARLEAGTFQISPTVTVPGATSYGIPAINNQGAVAFLAGNSSTGTGLYTALGSALTTVISPSSGWRNLGSPSINDSGVAAFSGTNPAFAAGIFTGSGGPVTTVVSGLGPFAAGSLPGYGNPSIANNGTVVFVANNDGNFNSGPFASGIYSGNGGPLTTIFSSSNFHVEPLDPAISKDGSSIVYQDPSVAFGSIFSMHGGTTTTLATTGPFSPAYSVSVNNAGTSMILFGTGNANATDITILNGNSSVEFAARGSFFADFPNASMNNEGQVAFLADLQNGPSGIYVGPSFDNVISVGDPLAGSTITHLQFGTEGLNDSGQIAFLATLANGQDGVFIASAVASSVPEPTSIALLAISAAALFAMRRRKA